MKIVGLSVLAAFLLIPSTTFAWHFRHHHRHLHDAIILRHYHRNSGAITAGVLGGVVTGIILDRVLISPNAYPPPVMYYPPPQVYYSPLPPAPRPAPRDPYDQGYSHGYQQGFEEGRRQSRFSDH